MKSLGIDWGRSWHQAALVDETGRVVHSARFPATARACHEFLDGLERFGGPAEVRVGIEGRCDAWLALLAERGYVVFEINPKQADRFRDRFFASGAKDDRRDAEVLAWAVHADAERLRPLPPRSDACVELAALCSTRRRLVQRKTQCMTQLLDALVKYHPALPALGHHSDSDVLLALLRRFPDPATAARARKDVLARLLAAHRIHRYDAAELQRRLREPAAPLAPALVRALRREALFLADEIDLLKDQIDAIEHDIDHLFESLPAARTLRSLPALGRILAPTVYAALADVAPSIDPRRAQTLCGTAPVTRISGRVHGGSVRMRRACDRDLQSALHQWARVSVGCSSWARAYHDSRIAKGHSRNAVLRALANKWVKILWRVLVSHEPYDERRHVADLLAAGVDWAKPLAPLPSEAA